jgi:hypothetical protein
MEEARELARLERRIAEVRRAIEQAHHGHGWSGNAPERERMLALLEATLRALEARKAALELTTKGNDAATGVGPAEAAARQEVHEA